MRTRNQMERAPQFNKVVSFSLQFLAASSFQFLLSLAWLDWLIHKRFGLCYLPYNKLEGANALSSAAAVGGRLRRNVRSTIEMQHAHELVSRQ